MKTNYSPIYLDYNATTPCCDEVVSKMMPYFGQHYGNASSSHHAYGWLAKDALEEATTSIANQLGVNPKELIYTSGSTEGINTILKGLFTKNRDKRNHIITIKTAHKAMLDVCAFLEEEGALVEYLDVDANGLINLETLKNCITHKTLVVALLYGNNETGVLQPLSEISKICKSKNCLLFADATQALGKIKLDNFFSQVDFACFSAHKLYGPKGIGFNYVSNEKSHFLTSFIQGGGQQHNMRGGTYNIPSIVGLAKAVALSYTGLNEEKERLQLLRDQLQNGLYAIEAIHVNGIGVSRLPNTLNVSFDFVDGEKLLRSLSRSIAVSNGSACNSAAVNPSHVLTAMGVSRTLAIASIRFSLGRYTNEDGISKTIQIVIDEIKKQRSENIMWERRQL